MVIDASVWVSALVIQDVNYEASRGWLRHHVGGDDPLVVPSLALAEVAGALSRRTTVPELGHQAVDALLRTPGVQIVGLDAQLGAEAARIAADYRLRGADAVYVTVAHTLNIPLLTWDQELQHRAARLIHVVHP